MICTAQIIAHDKTVKVMVHPSAAKQVE